MKSKSENSPDNKVETFWDNIVAIEEEWFSDANLNGGATFWMALIKCAKLISNQKTNFRGTHSDAFSLLQ